MTSSPVAKKKVTAPKLVGEQRVCNLYYQGLRWFQVFKFLVILIGKLERMNVSAQCQVTL